MEDPVPLVAVLAAKAGHEEERPSTRLARLAVERDQAVDALVARHPGRAEDIRRLVVELESCLPLGQDRYVALTEVGHAATRYQLLEMGRRLRSRGLLREPVDALYLDPSELEEGLIGGVDRRGLVAERKRIRNWQRGLRPPVTIGEEQSLDAVPYVIDSILSDRAGGLDFSVGPGAADGEEILLKGVAGSAGRYVGPARVCAGVADAVHLRRGDVLVCSTTSPAWTQYFGLIGAVVTDQGGLLSHPAVVAREYGIPAVIGADGATATVISGEPIGVDGGSGVVFTPAS
jgi:pyruvate,water dikinase